MTATAEPPAPAVEAPLKVPLDRAAGLELLGPVHGSGYKDGAALVRRRDGQMVQLGPLMYALLECVDGRRDADQLTEGLAERIGRRVDAEHVAMLADKLAAQGLLAGTEHEAPPRRNPLLALRWKVLVTDPRVTRRLTAPLTFLFRPWLMWPILACFVAVFWFVLFHKGVASATAQAFDRPGLLLLVFALAVASAGFHELGHAAACRYGGATPGGMGMGLYLVWPAFYTDVTDAYRLPRRDRLRVDLGGLYFNAVVAVVTMAVWLACRADALLLLIALQVLQMVKQLSPVIRADGYHILADATGVPDLYSQMGPTLRRLMPGRRGKPSALTGRARLLVTAWVLIIVPILLSLTLGAILVLPRLVTSAWDSGRHIASAIPSQAGDGQILDLLASLVRLMALSLPVLGSILVTQKVVRSTVVKAVAWSRGQPVRRGVVLFAGAAVVAALAWAWWPSGQYQPVRADQGGTLGSLVQTLSAPGSVARPNDVPAQAQLTPGTHLAVAMIPVGGATRRDPALFVIPTGRGKPAVAVVSASAPKLPRGTTGAPSNTATSGAGGASSGAPVTTSTPSVTTTTPGPSAGAATNPGSSPATRVTAFPFTLPSRPGPGGTQALAVGTKTGGVTYAVAYALVTVGRGDPVTETNSAYALADCRSCTTVAVSFQVVLVVGRSKTVAPINVAEALNDNCPACVTTAVADQIVVTLSAKPSAALLAKLNADLKQLGALPRLGAGGTPAAVAAAVGAVQREIDTQLKNSGLLTVSGNPDGSSTTDSTGSPGAGAPTTSTSSTTTAQSATTPTTASPSSTPASSAPGTGQSSTTQTSQTSTPSTTTPTTTTTTSATTQTASTPSESTTQTQPTSTATGPSAQNARPVTSSTATAPAGSS